MSIYYHLEFSNSETGETWDEGADSLYSSIKAILDRPLSDDETLVKSFIEPNCWIIIGAENYRAYLRATEMTRTEAKKLNLNIPD